ncbi:MAG: class I SAM-dependent methyltransferase [Stenotrophomonas sp.]
MNTTKSDMNVRDVSHPFLARLESEDLSRQRAVVLLRRVLSSRIRSQNPLQFNDVGAPSFHARHGHAPQSTADIEESLFEIPTYRMWSAANRAVQEMLWLAVGEPIYRDEERILHEVECALRNPNKHGSLSLNEEYTPSPEVASVDIHLQPGGYALERGPKDVVAGALYEAGGNIFSFSVGGRRDDSKAAATTKLMQNIIPGFEPKKILEIGCSAGSASAAYAWRFPNAEVHAIDIGAAMLRYAHVRAEALGVSVHFHQMDAAKLGFSDSSFDLVVSHNALHEMGDETRSKMIAESMRVLRPGGLLIYQDVNVRSINDPLLKADLAWEKHFNGERFWTIYGDANLREEIIDAGFPVSDVMEHEIPAVAGALRWYVISARKPTNGEQGK